MKKKYHEGIFYPFESEMEPFLKGIEQKEEAKAIILPHQALYLSYPLIRKGIAHMGKPELVVIISPIHSGRTESDREYSFFEGEENREYGIINLGAKKSEWYAEEESGAEIILPYIRRYAPGADTAVIYTDIKSAAESKALSSFLKKTTNTETLFIISTNLSSLKDTIEEAEEEGRKGVEALEAGDNILDMMNRKKIHLCARGAVDSINRITGGEWKLEELKSGERVSHGVLWKER